MFLQGEIVAEDARQIEILAIKPPDGSEPTVQSVRYEKPFCVTGRLSACWTA